MTKKRVNFTIEKVLFKAFREHCEEKGYKMSTLIERLIKVELDVVEIKKSLKPSKENLQKIDRELWGIG